MVLACARRSSSLKRDLDTPRTVAVFRAVAKGALIRVAIFQFYIAVRGISTHRNAEFSGRAERPTNLLFVLRKLSAASAVGWLVGTSREILDSVWLILPVWRAEGSLSQSSPWGRNWTLPPRPVSQVPAIPISADVFAERRDVAQAISFDNAGPTRQNHRFPGRPNSSLLWPILIGHTHRSLGRANSSPSSRP